MSLISLLKKKNNKLLFTTPSHSGKHHIIHKFYNWYKSDISEVDAYNPDEELIKAESFATKIYKTKHTYFLTNGSTSGIIAAVLTCCSQNDKILIWNKSHPCHRNAAKLAGARIIEYELPFNKEWGIYDKIQPEYVEKLLKENRPKAIIITYPTYEGIVCDIKKLKDICKKYDTYLIADEAHGALYPFSNELPKSSINIADFTIQSLHKTAGGINPTALLHSNCNLDTNKYLKMINTTSPSYPMLATIEANIRFLNSNKGKKEISKLINCIQELKASIKNIEFYGDDITKILIKAKGLTGLELSEKLFREFNIEDERTNSKSTMLLTGIGTSSKKLLRLKNALNKIDNTI